MRLKTEPAFVRCVLDTYTKGGWAAVKADHPKVSIEVARRWIKARGELGPEWPTWEMQAEWRAKEEARRKQAAHMRDWRARTNYGRRPVLVDARGTIRRIRALQALGWTFQHIANAAGMPSRCLIPDLVDRKTVRPETAAAIDKAYRAMCMKVGPSNKTRRIAARKGWPPPLAWDDIDLDPEPPKVSTAPAEYVDEAIVSALLAGRKVKSTPEEKRAATKRWLDMGRPNAEFCRIHGWAPGRYTPKKQGSRAA